MIRRLLSSTLFPYTTLFRSYFSDDYLARCREMSPDEVLDFLENFRLLHGGERPASRLISLKDRKSTRLNSSHTVISYAVFCLKKKTHYSSNKTSSTMASP